MTMMRFELDHLFVAVSGGGPEVDPLVRAGFLEGPSNRHPGQGTACRRIFFMSGYLEFIWLEDAAEARSPLTAPTGLAARVGEGRAASHTGVCLRSVDGTLDDLPVATWSYRPRYLPNEAVIRMAANSSKETEPLLFFLPGLAPHSRARPGHANGSERITRVELTLAGDQERSAELQWLAGSGCVRVASGVHESVSVELDHGVQGRRMEVGTRTPLTLSW